MEEPEMQLKGKKVTDKFTESVYVLANEPSVALYRLQEHVRRSLPELAQHKVRAPCPCPRRPPSLCTCVWQQECVHLGGRHGGRARLCVHCDPCGRHAAVGGAEPGGHLHRGVRLQCCQEPGGQRRPLPQRGGAPQAGHQPPGPHERRRPGPQVALHPPAGPARPAAPAPASPCPVTSARLSVPIAAKAILSTVSWPWAGHWGLGSDSHGHPWAHPGAPRVCCGDRPGGWGSPDRTGGGQGPWGLWT